MSGIERKRFALVLPFNKAVLDVRVSEDASGFVRDMIVARAEWYMAAGAEHERVDETREVPADWWEHLKQRFFPSWAKGMWPVVTESIHVASEVVRVCPHVSHDVADHVDFLRGGPGG